MLEIGRTVRFCLRSDGSLNDGAPVSNSFAAWPPMEGFGRYYELEVVCAGEADPVTGYFLNIKTIDQVARTAALPLISKAVQTAQPLGSLMGAVFGALDRALQGVVKQVELRLTPTYAVRIEGAQMSEVLISQRYQFAAAHRLHAEALDDAENQEVFGKCNNPHGHGHNYHLEVTVRQPMDAEGSVEPVQALDALIDQTVIEQLDHKNLDLDVPQFKSLNSSVENIAMVIYRMLDEPTRAKGWGLDQVRVWETAKTVCTYRGDSPTP